MTSFLSLTETGTHPNVDEVMFNQKHLKVLPVVKSLSDTRWSDRHDAVRALNLGYKENISAL